MNPQKILVPTIDPDGKWLYRVGGIAALIIGLGYIAIIPLFASVGALPHGGEAWLTYLVGKTTVWWIILGLSVFTDFLFVPVAFALYLALQGVNRNAMLVATAFVGLFVALDLVVTWSNYAALIALSGNYVSAATDAQRMTDIAAATYAAAVVSSSLEAVYAIVVLSCGILLMSLVMLRGVFKQFTAYVGVITGALGIVAITGWSVAVILNAVFATVWIVLIGFRLLRLSQQL